jgi:hypothetical protein
MQLPEFCNKLIDEFEFDQHEKTKRGIMKLDKNRLNVILSKWIKWDGELWAELREIQIKLLFDRIVQEMNYAELCKLYKTSPDKIQESLHVIFAKIEKSHGKELADLIREINQEIAAKGKITKPKRQHLFDFETIFLN